MANEKQQWTGTHTRNSCLMRAIKKKKQSKPKKPPQPSVGERIIKGPEQNKFKIWQSGGKGKATFYWPMSQLSAEPLTKPAVLTIKALPYFSRFLGLPHPAQTACTAPAAEVGPCSSTPPTTQHELGASFNFLHLDERENVNVLCVGDWFWNQNSIA